MGRCYNSVLIGASVDTVWNTIRDFHETNWAAGVVTRIEKVGPVPGTQIGAQRILNGVFHETLRALDDQEHSFEYTIDDGPGPVARDQVKNYVGRVRVHPVTSDNSTFVEWESTYDSADDSAVGEFCNPIYQALLGALKKHLG